MAEESAAIVEPPPVTPEGEARATEAVMSAFDKFAPLPQPKEPTPPTEDKTPEPPKPKPEKKEIVSEPPKGKILPSFLSPPKVEGAPDVSKPDAPAAPEEWPEELPGTKDTKTQGQWKRFKEFYKTRTAEVETLKRENETLRAQNGTIPQETTEKLQRLEKDNAELLGYVERYSLQNHPKFVNQIEQPLARARDAARSILKDAGGDPAQLDSAFTAHGKARYEILDELTQGIPESAKGELLATFKDVRAIEERRNQILADPKRTMESLRKEDIQTQRAQLEAQTKQLDNTLNDIVSSLRDNDKLEVLQRTTDPKEGWWNEQGEQIVSIAREILHSPDPKKLTAAIVLGASADVYRGLFLDANERARKAEGELASLRGKEPSFEGEPSEDTVPSEAKDFKQPFSAAFIQTLNRQRNRG